MHSIEYETDCPILLQSIYSTLGEKRCIIETKRKILILSRSKTLDMFLMEREKNCGRKVLSYDLCLKLLHNLEEQNRFLLGESFCIYCVRVEDILVVNDEHFVFTNPDCIKKVDSSKISFFSPFRRNGFLSPELLTIEELPARSDWKTFYYSLGLLVSFCISGNLVDGNLVDGNLRQCLKSIANTKLYWSILRLVSFDPEKRRFLYV